MSNRKNIGTILLVVGVIVLIAALTSDMLGLGGDIRTFGMKQIAGVVTGLIVAAAGLVLRLKKA